MPFFLLCFKNQISQIGFIIVQALLKAFTKLVTFSGAQAVRGRPVDFCFNADPVALKLITHNKIVFRAGTGSCLPRLKCKRNARSRSVAATDSFVLINVSTMKAQSSPIQFRAANEKQWHHKETKQISIS